MLVTSASGRGVTVDGSHELVVVLDRAIVRTLTGGRN